MHCLSKLFFVATALAVAVAGTGCAHSVNFTSEPAGAEVYLDGQKIGTAPFTYEEKSGMYGSKAELVAKQGGKEKKMTLTRDKPAIMPIVAGAGIGTGACLAASCGITVVGFIVPFCFFGYLPALVLMPAGAVGGWYLFGNQLPDTVAIDMKDAVPAGSADKGAPPPAAAY